MKLHIDTDDEIEGDSWAATEALVNLKEAIPPGCSQPNSPPHNSTRLDRPKMISPRNILKLQEENEQLKEELHEYKELDQVLKTKNTTLKGFLAQYHTKDSDMCA